jgi:hypothetical protein
MTPPNAPQAPKFIPMSIGDLSASGLIPSGRGKNKGFYDVAPGFNYFQTLGYNAADADLAKRFPGLVAQRDQNVQEASQAITGPLPPEVQNTFATNALARSLSTTGGSGLSGIGGVGSAGREQAAASIARDTLQKQDYDRQYLNQQFADQPARAFSLSPDDIINLSVGNTAGANAARFQQYAGSVAQQNADIASQNQTIGLGATVAASLASALILY